VAAGLALLATGICVLAWKNLFPAIARSMQDMDVYQRSGRDVLAGTSVYDTPFPRLPFTYPPFAALLATVTAPFAVRWLNVVWMLGIVGGLLYLVRVSFAAALERVVPARRFFVAAAIATALLWTQPVVENVLLGQVNVLLAVLVVADLVVDHPRWPRGALIGVATAMKLTPAVFIVYLLVTGRRKAAGTAVAAFAACTALAAIVLPGDSRRYWTDVVFSTGRIGHVEYTSNQSLHGIVARVVGGTAGTALWVALAAAIAVIGFARARRAFLAGNEVAGIAITGLLAVALSPIAWVHHLVWVVFALGVLAGDLRDRRRVAAAVVLGGLLLLRVPWWIDGLLDGVARPLGLILQDLYGLIALGLVLWLPIGRPVREPAATPVSAAA